MSCWEGVGVVGVWGGRGFVVMVVMVVMAMVKWQVYSTSKYSPGNRLCISTVRVLELLKKIYPMPSLVVLMKFSLAISVVPNISFEKKTRDVVFRGRKRAGAWRSLFYIW